MLHHSGLLEGGWLGVDVFFSLSGFLITSLLLEEHERTGGISLGPFYARRALRLLPALLVLLGVCGTIMVAWSPPELFRDRLLYVVAIVLYVANWAMILGLPLYALAHTWSLAIEEQFYLLWPPALSLLTQRVRHRVPIVLIVVAGIAGAIVWRSLLMSRGASTPRVFLGLDTRADSVLIGCGLAMMLTWNMAPRLLGGGGRKWVTAVAVAALCVLFATARFPVAFRDYFVSTLTALAAGILIIHLLTPGSRLARFFETRLLTGVGKISYGLYLWHFPIFLGLGVLVSRSTGFDPVRLVLAWVLTFTVSLVSFRFIEQPALRLKARWVR